MAEGLPPRFTRAEGAAPEAAGEDLAAALARLATAGEVVKDEPETLLLRGQGCWWKLYRVLPRRRLFAWLGRSRALREWQALRCLEGAGVPVAPPVAFAEDRRSGILRSSLLVTRDLAEASDLRRLWQQAAEAPERRLALAAAAGTAAAALHGGGFGHFRMQLRNLVRDEQGGVHWLDAPYACRWAGATPRRVAAVDLADLCGAGSPMTLAESEACLLAYAASAGWAPAAAALGSRGRLPQKLRRIAYYLLANATGHRMPPTP